MIGLVEELGRLIEDDDPLWYAFGLNRPGDPESPEPVETPTLTPGGPGIVLVDWAPAPRATRYKVQRQLTPDGAFEPVAETEDDHATLTSQPSGSTITLRILAANPAGEALPSPEVSLLVP